MLISNFTNKEFFFSQPYIYNIDNPPFNNFFRNQYIPAYFFRDPIYNRNNIELFTINFVDYLQIFGLTIDRYEFPSKNHNLPIIIELQDTNNETIGNYCHQAFIFYANETLIDMIIELFFNHIILIKNTIMVDNVDWARCSNFWSKFVEQSLKNEYINVYQYDQLNNTALPLIDLNKFISEHGPFLELSSQYKILISIINL